MVNYSITQYGESRFELDYSNKELLEIIESFIRRQKEENSDCFTYYTLCKFILLYAENNNKLKGKEANTYYQQPNLSPKEYTRISRLLWSFILEKRVFIDFSNKAYMAHYEDDTIFGLF